MTLAYLNLAANCIQVVLYLLNYHSLSNASHFLPHPFRILFPYCSCLCSSLDMTFKLLLFLFSALRRCYVTRKQLYYGWWLFAVHCVGVQLVVLQLNHRAQAVLPSTSKLWLLWLCCTAVTCLHSFRRDLGHSEQ